MSNKKSVLKILIDIYRETKAILMFIIRRIDRYIVIPITKFFLIILEKLDNNTKSFERLLNKKTTLIFLSLLVSLIIFFLVDNKTLTLVETSAEVIYNQPVKTIYNEEKYVIEGLPKAVDITLIGRKSDLYLAKQLSINEITVDLSDLKPGTHKINIKYKQAITSIDYKIDPSVVTIIVYPKLSNIKGINVDVLNKDKIDSKLNVGNVLLSKDEVIIKGAEHTLAKVSAVKAMVDLNKLPSQEIGDIVLKDVPLIAYDETGNKVDVELVPNKIDATITITSPSKELPIKVIPKGELAFGKAISSITLDSAKVIVYGDEATLDKLNYVPIEIDVSGLKQNNEYNITLKKPVGIKYMSVKNVKVNLIIENEISKQIDNISIEYKNLASDLTVQALSKEDSAVPVIIKGVESVLNGLNVDNIQVYVDLAGYKAGEYEIDVKVVGDDLKVTYMAKTKKVKLRISNK